MKSPTKFYRKTKKKYLIKKRIFYKKKIMSGRGTCGYPTKKGTSCKKPSGNSGRCHARQVKTSDLRNTNEQKKYRKNSKATNKETKHVCHYISLKNFERVINDNNIQPTPEDKKKMNHPCNMRMLARATNYKHIKIDNSLYAKSKNRKSIYNSEEKQRAKVANGVIDKLFSKSSPFHVPLKKIYDVANK